MNSRVLKVLGLLAGLCLALGVGALVGGGAVYAMTQLGGAIPVAKAQQADPGYGIVIASVEPEGPAAEAGVVRGDILLEVDGQVVEGPSDLMHYLDESEPGDEVELTVLHGDDGRTLMATLGDRNGWPYLGLFLCSGLHPVVEEHLGSPGALVIEVMPDSPAERAGLQEGDLILSVDGQGVGAENSLADLIADYEPGDVVTLEVGGPGEEPDEVTVELGQHPDDADVAYLGVRCVPFPRAGVLRGELSPFGDFGDFEFDFDELPFAFPEGNIEQGAIIRRVYDDGPASAAGLVKGDVITAVDDEPVTSPKALIDAIAEREPGDRVTLTVYQRDSEEERETEVTLGEHPDEEGKAYLGVLLGGFFRIEHLEGDEPLRGFEFLKPPSDELPFDLDELPHRFDFHWQWPPGGDCDGWPGCAGDSV